MERKVKIGKHSFSDLLLKLIVFTLPFYQKASIIAIILLVVIWILEKKYLILISGLKRHSVILLLMIYFFVHFIGLLWSDNMKYGWSDIETKLSFFILPMVFATLTISSDLKDKIKSSFIAGNILACFYCIISSTIFYIQTGDQTVFFYTSLSKFIHTTYFTFYLNLALIFLIEATIKNWKNSSVIKKSGLAMAHLFIVVMIISLSARMAIAVSLVTILVYCISQIVKFRKGIFILLSSLVVSLILNFAITHLYNRYTQVEETVQLYNNTTNEKANPNITTETYNSTSSRIELWKEAFQVIQRNWLIGVGTGDIKDELMKEYANNHFEYGIEKNYNPHNQYLHTGVVLGVVGLMLLLCCLLIPLYAAFQKQNWIHICFILLIMLNALTESILEVQSGIIFFAIFYSLFVTDNQQTDKNYILRTQ